MGKDIHGSYGVSFLEPIHNPIHPVPKKNACPTKPSKELKGQLRGVLTDVSPKADFDRFKPLGFRRRGKKNGTDPHEYGGDGWVNIAYGNRPFRIDGIQKLESVSHSFSC